MNQGNRKYIEFDIFKKYPEVVTAVSTRNDGTIKKDKSFQMENAKAFLKDVGIDFNNTVFMKQIHSSKVTSVDSSHIQIIQNTDGLATTQKNIFLAVVTADCVPIIFYEPVKKIIAAIHAGYKGILQGIIEEALSEIQKLGGRAENLLVGIAPSIGACCYDVSDGRISEFKNKYPNFKGYYEIRSKKNFLDLAALAQNILSSKGVKNVEQSTSCTKDTEWLYSYRRDSHATYGEFATVIGMV